MVELVAALQGNVPVILLVGAEDLSVYHATSSLESEGAPIGAFQPNPAMLDTLVEMVDVGKAVASVEADRVRELGHVKEQVGVIPANCKAKGAIVAANHTMGVVPVLHATATRSLAPIRALDRRLQRTELRPRSPRVRASSRLRARRLRARVRAKSP